jgi:hypothetical protein
MAKALRKAGVEMPPSAESTPEKRLLGDPRATKAILGFLCSGNHCGLPAGGGAGNNKGAVSSETMKFSSSLPLNISFIPPVASALPIASLFTSPVGLFSTIATSHSLDLKLQASSKACRAASPAGN